MLPFRALALRTRHAVAQNRRPREWVYHLVNCEEFAHETSESALGPVMSVIWMIPELPDVSSEEQQPRQSVGGLVWHGKQAMPAVPLR